MVMVQNCLELDLKGVLVRAFSMEDEGVRRE